jgi:hypothetical protein
MSRNSRNEVVLANVAEVMLENRVVDYIDVSEGEELPPDAIVNFVLALEERGTPLKVEFGSVDPQITMLLRQLAMGNPDIVVPVETTQRSPGAAPVDLDDPPEPGKTTREAIVIPAIDDKEILDQFEREFAIERLLDEITKT